MTFLVQTLLVRQHKVLLGRWHTGAFKGRVTGLLGSAPGTPDCLVAWDGLGAFHTIGRVPKPQPRLCPCKTTPFAVAGSTPALGASPEVAATRICRPHLGPVEAQRLRRRGIFQFEEWGLRVLAHSQLGARVDSLGILKWEWRMVSPKEDLRRRSTQMLGG